MQASARRAIHRSSKPFTRRDVWERGGNECIYCEAELSYENWEMDHFVPLIQGGSHSVENCVVACKPCNRKKHSKMPEEFLGILRNSR